MTYNVFDGIKKFYWSHFDAIIHRNLFCSEGESISKAGVASCRFVLSKVSD